MPPAKGAEAPSAAGESLRELSWGDLRARLDAARDLRVTLAHAQVEDPASFDAPAARHVAALEHGKEAVNPSDLANGKGPACNRAAERDAATGPLRT